MHIWITYVRERFPLPTFAMLAAGISLSGIYLNGGVFSWLPFLISFVGILLAFFTIRFMDDVKDLEKDRIAYADRPLARGLIKKPVAVEAVKMWQIALFAYSLVIWVVLQEVAALTYVCVAIFLWLIYEDFYLGRWMARHPFLHKLFEQLFMFPLVFFAVAAGRPEQVIQPATWAFGAMLAGAFFCYDICHKLDPHAHPVIGSLVHFFGFRRAFEVAALALAISAMSAYVLHLALILVPCQLMVLFGLALLFFQPRWFKLPETMAGLSLMLHAWAVVLLHYHYG